jgi:hypothetical protein
MSETNASDIREILLRRRGLAVAPLGSGRAEAVLLQAIEIELAQIGYVCGTRLRARLEAYTPDELGEFCRHVSSVLLRAVGGEQRHTPLFRKFPDGIPRDTASLWWRKVLVHYLQSDGQPCLYCGHVGSTHVLNPCAHVVCDRCFDGSSYSACPICEHHVDRSSPFFSSAPSRELPKERVVFKRLDLCDDLDGAASELFVSLCQRNQALSTDDREALAAIVSHYRLRVLEWTPKEIPLRENVAIIFGVLLRILPSLEVFEAAKAHLATATDLLRVIAVTAGADGSLQGESQVIQVDPLTMRRRIKLLAQWEKAGHLARLAGRVISVPVTNHRFKTPRYSRQMRRSFLAFLDAIPLNQLIEDMLRHQEYWVGLGERLHPGEYEKRFSSVARAFRMVRKKSPEGERAPRFLSWNRRLEIALHQSDIQHALALLTERPGEFARRLDWVLRLVAADSTEAVQVIGAFISLAPEMATPVLLTLRSHLSQRDHAAPVRVYWPKGRVARGVLSADTRDLLARSLTAEIIEAIERELISRFEAKRRFEVGIVDETLRDIPVPFNERTASPSAVTLPRGSSITVSLKKALRLFMYWRQPQTGGHATDLDLSVAFYDENWDYIGVCSYYQLTCKGPNGAEIARSAGDLRDAPYPEGASEFVDVDCLAAKAAGARFVVMVVNNYAGMPFSQLDLAFAGYMNRDDTGGHHFDPRTVEMKFNVTGENGVFTPLVLDLVEQRIHWLDVQSKGMMAFNNVESSNAAITKVCPAYMAYFRSGVRPDMFTLGLMHAAARCKRVVIRGKQTRTIERRNEESVGDFYKRLTRLSEPLSFSENNAGESAALALLLRGDIDLADGSAVYAIFRKRTCPTLSAGDLLS